MISIGPVIFGLILGLIIGSKLKLKNNDTDFTLPAFIIIIIAGIIMAWQTGNYPFYTDFPISTAYFSALFGMLIGKAVFARGL